MSAERRDNAETNAWYNSRLSVRFTEEAIAGARMLAGNAAKEAANIQTIVNPGEEIRKVS